MLCQADDQATCYCLEISNGFYNCQVLIQRSTCPPGTAYRFSKRFKKTHYAVNPSFLAKSTQWEDSIQPVRIAYAGNKYARAILEEIYAPFEDVPRFTCEKLETVELLKYIENITDAVLISLWNEFLEISDSLQIPRLEFADLIKAFVQRPRFGTAVRIPGQGFGLWCLPKDLAAMINELNQIGSPSNVLQGAEQTNKLISEKCGQSKLATTELFDVVDGKIVLSSAGLEHLLRQHNTNTR